MPTTPQPTRRMMSATPPEEPNRAGRTDGPSELALQRRWAEACWPGPWLHLAQALQSKHAGQSGESRQAVRALRVCFAGRWNRSAGPDFSGAILLDAEGYARRGDVELHRRPSGWRAHGHDADPAYARVLLHVVGATGPDHSRSRPPAALLPLANAAPPTPDPRHGPHEEPHDAVDPERTSATAPPFQPPCTVVLEQAGAAAVSARLTRLARGRLQRKTAALRRRRAAFDERADGDELLTAWAAARALGMPHNAEIIAAALEKVWREDWDEQFRTKLAGALSESNQWRNGRGALGRREGAAAALAALLARWGRGQLTHHCRRLAQLKPSAAAAELQIARLLGPIRARQLLADAIYPAAIALGEPSEPLERRWRSLPAARYQRTDPLRERLSAARCWQHGEAQALLELERAWCRNGACAVCPLGRLAASRSRPAIIPSLNIPIS